MVNPLETWVESQLGAFILIDAKARVLMATPAARTRLGLAFKPGDKLQLEGEWPRDSEAVPLVLRLSEGADARRVKLQAQAWRHESGSPRGLCLRLPAQVHAREEASCFHGLWTADARMKEVFAIVERVARENFTVLVRGETGTGKELIAQAIHALSPRHRGPFRVINCAAVPGSLLESELFGHARGAFTGATRDTPGHIQMADGGTLFLDEVAELPLELQAKLLRVVETGRVLPLGRREAIPVDVRFVSATHRALRKEVEAGRFRADLMYRLRVIPIFLPPLRERPGDLRLLSEGFIQEMNRKGHRQIHSLDPRVIPLLERYPFYGNVRELRNILTYAYAIGEGPVLRSEDLPYEVRHYTPPDAAREPESPALPAEDQSLESTIRAALAQHRGRRREAAEALGMSRVTLWRHMQRLGIAQGKREVKGGV